MLAAIGCLIVARTGSTYARHCRGQSSAMLYGYTAASGEDESGLESVEARESTCGFSSSTCVSRRTESRSALAVVLVVLVLACILPIQWLTRKGNDA